MKILSLSEDESVAREADELCRAAEFYREHLNAIECGSSVTLDGRLYRCISSDKNRIFTITGKHGWYLKFSLQEDWISREIAGAEAVRTTLADFAGYLHPGAIRASMESRYTLYSAVEGRSFNAILLHGCLARLPKLGVVPWPAMNNLGRCLARFHNFGGPEDMLALNPSTLSYLRTYLDGITAPGLLVEQVADWVDRQSDDDCATAWIHGNIKSEDVLIEDDKACIIDFGTCGAGAPYEDLVNLGTYLMLFRAVPLFPWRTARQALSALLQGYMQESALDRSRFYSYITKGVFRYYLKNMVMHDGIASISGMPVQRRRIEHIIRQLLDEDYETAFAGVRF